MRVQRGHRPGVTASAVALVILAGCTSSVPPSESPTSIPTSSASPSDAQSQSAPITPTPTPAWSVEQAAAIEAVRNLAAADGQIGNDPAAFTEKQMKTLLEPFSGGQVLTSSIKWNLRLKERGYRFTGEVLVLSVEATKPVDEGRGIEVHVTQCQDQRQGKVVDKAGSPVTDEDLQIPDYNLRQFAVRKPPGEDAFRVFGFQTINGACP